MIKKNFSTPPPSIENSWVRLNRGELEKSEYLDVDIYLRGSHIMNTPKPNICSNHLEYRNGEPESH